MELYVSFQEIARYFRSHRKNFILFILAVGILCGLLPLKFARYSYSGSTTLTFTCDVPSNAESDYQLQYTNILYSRVQSAVALASGDTLLEKTAEKAGIDPSDISKITAVQLNSAPVVKLTVYTPDAENAARLSDTAAQILGEEMEKQFPSPKLSSSVSDRSLPSKPKSKKIAVAEAGILGLLLGFVLSVAFGILRVLCDKTVRNGRFAEEDLKLPLLAEIPAQKKEDAYRRMRTAVLHHAPDAGVFLVTGVFRENGAADVAAGFASSLARIGAVRLFPQFSAFHPAESFRTSSAGNAAFPKRLSLFPPSRASASFRLPRFPGGAPRICLRARSFRNCSPRPPAFTTPSSCWRLRIPTIRKPKRSARVPTP